MRRTAILCVSLILLDFFLSVCILLILIFCCKISHLFCVLNIIVQEFFFSIPPMSLFFSFAVL